MNPDKLELLKKDKSIEALKLLLESIKQTHGIDDQQLSSLLFSKDELAVPLSAFSADALSSLEIVVKYLKENRSMQLSEIARCLDRDQRTIWSTYNNAKRKYPRLLSGEGHIRIPVAVIADRTKSVLGSVVLFLKEQGLSFNQISDALKKDYQTIYTTYRRWRR